MNLLRLPLVYTSTSPAATRRFARRFAGLLSPGDLVSLTGQLGAGKTEFVRGVAAFWGVNQRVSSPSFVRVHSYGGNPPLFHADFYLAKSLEDALDYGLDELIEQGGVVLVEWGERFAEILPGACFHVRINLDNKAVNNRRIEISH